jgi:hypothetical protein
MQSWKRQDHHVMLETIVMWALRTTSSNDLDLDCQSAQVPPFIVSFFEGMGETCLSKRSRRNETTSQGMMTMTLLWRRSQQRSFMAQSALTYMKTNNHLTTEFSNQQQVLQKGFPRQWNPCVLEQQSIPKLTIALVGGSTAARPGSHCRNNSQGRYTDMLQNKLDQVMVRYNNNKNNNTTANANHNSSSIIPMMIIIVRNLAQGATITVDNAIVMDQYFVPGQTDVIVWDFWINGKTVFESKQIMASDQERMDGIKLLSTST